MKSASQRQTKLQLKETTDWLLWALKAPILTYKDQEWYVVDSMRQRITTERLAKLLRNDQEKEATDFEAFIYLMSITMARPLGHNEYRLFDHLAHVCMDWKEELSFEKDTEQFLKGIKRWIFKQQKDGKTR